MYVNLYDVYSCCYCAYVVLGIVTERGTETETEIVTGSMIGKEEGIGHVKGGVVAAVTVVHAGNEAAAENGEITTRESGTIEVTSI